jgi:hypothetical protein
VNAIKDKSDKVIGASYIGYKQGPSVWEDREEPMRALERYLRLNDGHSRVTGKIASPALSDASPSTCQPLKQVGNATAAKQSGAAVAFNRDQKKASNS